MNCEVIKPPLYSRWELKLLKHLLVQYYQLTIRKTDDRTLK